MALDGTQLKLHVQQLENDLNDAITKGAWGGAAAYIDLYTNYLSLAQQLIPGIELAAAKKQGDFYTGGGSVEGLLPNQREWFDKQAMLYLKPLVGQLLTFLR